MQYLYGIIFLASLILLPLYFAFVRKKQDEPWLFVLFVCVCIVNLGYTLIAFSKTVEFALFANKIAYLGQVVMPLCMFILISGLCGFTYKKWVKRVLIGLAGVMFFIVCTAGYLDWYYTDASIETVAGATVLRKEYGVLHPTNLIYVITYFIGMISILALSLRRHRGASQKHASGMLVIVLGNILMWCVGKVIPWDVELLSVTYLMSAGGFFAEWLMLQDYVRKSDIPKYTSAERERLGAEISSLSMEEKLNKVLKVVKEHDSLVAREREILELILKNEKRKDIARELYLSENTVKTYTRTLYSKLGVTSRAELYELLLQN